MFCSYPVKVKITKELSFDSNLNQYKVELGVVSPDDIVEKCNVVIQLGYNQVAVVIDGKTLYDTDLTRDRIDGCSSLEGLEFELLRPVPCDREN